VIFRGAFEAMRTRFELVLEGGDESRLAAAAEDVRAEVEACEDRLSHFRPGSVVSRINASRGSRVRVDPETFDLLSLAARVHRDSGGAFDPTVGPLMRAWGFRGETDCRDGREARPARGMEHLHLDDAGCDVSLDCDANVGQLDLGAIAKGHALDLAATRLAEVGVRRGLLHAGTSSVLAMEAAEGSPGWKVGLAGVAANVTLRRMGLGVSAPHGRMVAAAGGSSAGHVMDPRTGRPAIGATLAATACVSAAAADAWSTALLVAGEAGMAWEVRELGGRLVALGAGDVRSRSDAGPRPDGTGESGPWCWFETGA
jgi:thiamine biosynthesis lipoprotein